MIYRPPHCSAMLGQGQFLWSNVLLRQIISTMYTVHSGAKILFPVLHTAARSDRNLTSQCDILRNLLVICLKFQDVLVSVLVSNCKVNLSQIAKSICLNCKSICITLQNVLWLWWPGENIKANNAWFLFTLGSHHQSNASVNLHTLTHHIYRRREYSIF